MASVFAYVVLSAGLFSSEKTEEAVSDELEPLMSTIELKGNIIARMKGGVVQEIYLNVGISAAGYPADFSPATSNNTCVVISYHDKDNLIPSLNWTVTKLTSLNDDYILDQNELFTMTVNLASSADAGIRHTTGLLLKSTRPMDQFSPWKVRFQPV